LRKLHPIAAHGLDLAAAHLAAQEFARVESGEALPAESRNHRAVKQRRRYSSGYAAGYASGHASSPRRFDSFTV
jgi:hypothetical protein